MMSLVLQDVPHLQFLIRVNLSQKINQGVHATGMSAGPLAQGTAFLPVGKARETCGNRGSGKLFAGAKSIFDRRVQNV
jgi:hypothetical protein